MLCNVPLFELPGGTPVHILVCNCTQVGPAIRFDDDKVPVLDLEAGSLLYVIEFGPCGFKRHEVYWLRWLQIREIHVAEPAWIFGCLARLRGRRAWRTIQITRSSCGSRRKKCWMLMRHGTIWEIYVRAASRFESLKSWVRLTVISLRGAGAILAEPRRNRCIAGR